jgi:hypothetical protein
MKNPHRWVDDPAGRWLVVMAFMATCIYFYDLVWGL